MIAASAGTIANAARRHASLRTDVTTTAIARSASKYTENGKPAGFEFERFQQQGDTLVLTPFPEGMSSVSFPLTEYDAKSKRAVFENLAHDFPTRISYQRTGGNRLTILVSGPGEDGKEQVLTYDLQRK